MAKNVKAKVKVKASIDSIEVKTLALKDFTFDIFGTKWKVEYVDRVPVDDELDFRFGECDPVAKKILVAKMNRDGDDFLDEREIRLTLLHEITHAILSDGGYKNSNMDEPLVEWIAKCILSLREQDKI